ncbi:actin remodeling regulator NHS-like [Emydura macquarii macquarii]|uniref:actin remodeling regulator NHS-like n=1 Tax=Emydura macquarii macquarii TaxID=1129001 RepID=UPI00352A78B3
MPFPLRTVAPLKLCRLEDAGAGDAGRGALLGPAAAAASAGDNKERARAGGARRLFGSLEQVSSRSLVSLLWQLSDLSRCAGDIFGELQSQADAVCRRSARLQRRLGALRALSARLDHRRVKIRECAELPSLLLLLLFLARFGRPGPSRERSGGRKNRGGGMQAHA